MLGETSRLCVYWDKTVAVCYVEKEHGHGESGSSQLSNLPRFCRFACPSPSKINPQWKSLRDESLEVGRTFVREGSLAPVHFLMVGYVRRAVYNT